MAARCGVALRGLHANTLDGFIPVLLIEASSRAGPRPATRLPGDRPDDVRCPFGQAAPRRSCRFIGLPDYLLCCACMRRAVSASKPSAR